MKVALDSIKDTEPRREHGDIEGLEARMTRGKYGHLYRY